MAFSLENLGTYIDLFSVALDKGLQIDLLYTDFSNAFDLMLLYSFTLEAKQIIWSGWDIT